MEPHGMEMILVMVLVAVAQVVVMVLAVVLVPTQIVDVVEVAVLVNVDMHVPAEHVGQNVKEINQQLILPDVEPRTAAAAVMQIVQISVLTVAPAVTHHVPEVA